MNIPSSGNGDIDSSGTTAVIHRTHGDAPVVLSAESFESVISPMPKIQVLVTSTHKAYVA